MAGEEIAPRAAGQGQPIEGKPVQASPNGQLSQQELIQQIEQAQAELGRTVDAIADKVKPANVARRTADKLRQRVQTVDPKLVGAGAVVAAGLVAFVIWRRRRR
jgi:hypothetical protein